MNLANKLTISRILMIPIFLIFIIPLPEWTNEYIYLKNFNDFSNIYGNLIAFGIFAIASLTDALDGKIARKYNIVSNLGIFLDPIADKLLIMAALIVFVGTNKISSLAVILILSREFIVTGFRLVAADNKIVIPANNLGKIKTISQMILVVLILIGQYIFGTYHNIINHIFTCMVVLITIYSGLDYIYKNKSILTENK